MTWATRARVVKCRYDTFYDVACSCGLLLCLTTIPDLPTLPHRAEDFRKSELSSAIPHSYEIFRIGKIIIFRKSLTWQSRFRHACQTCLAQISDTASSVTAGGRASMVYSPHHSREWASRPQSCDNGKQGLGAQHSSGVWVKSVLQCHQTWQMSRICSQQCK